MPVSRLRHTLRKETRQESTKKTTKSAKITNTYVTQVRYNDAKKKVGRFVFPVRNFCTNRNLIAETERKPKSNFIHSRIGYCKFNLRSQCWNSICTHYLLVNDLVDSRIQESNTLVKVYRTGFL